MGEKSFERLTKGVGKREISEKKVGKSSTSFRRPWVKRISVAVRFSSTDFDFLFLKVPHRCPFQRMCLAKDSADGPR